MLGSCEVDQNRLLNKPSETCSKIMVWGSIDCHNSSEQLASELFPAWQYCQIGKDSTPGSHIPLWDELCFDVLYKDLALCGAIHMFCLRKFRHLVALAAMILQWSVHSYN